MRSCVKDMRKKIWHMPRKCEDHTLEDQRRELDKIEEIPLGQIIEHLERARTKGSGNSKQGSNLYGTSKGVEQEGLLTRDPRGRHFGGGGERQRGIGEAGGEAAC